MKNLINKNSTLFVMLLIIIAILLIGGYVWYTRSLNCAEKPADDDKDQLPTEENPADNEEPQD